MFKQRWDLTKAALGALLIMMILLTTGCALIDRLQAWKQTSGEQLMEIPPDPQELTMPQDGLVGETKEVVLYFSDQAGEKLALETRAIAKVEGIARATVQELLAGPSVESGLLPTIPVGTKLTDINVRPDGLCIVDFSSELVDNHPGGSLNEELTVYSIVNTLTQFPTIQEVQILVDGQKVESIAGHLDVSTTMARNNDIIEER
ncbi:MAG: GerMN domain-containing protein [Bacillota bacterium]